MLQLDSSTPSNTYGQTWTVTNANGFDVDWKQVAMSTDGMWQLGAGQRDKMYYSTDGHGRCWPVERSRHVCGR